MGVGANIATRQAQGGDAICGKFAFLFNLYGLFNTWQVFFTALMMSGVFRDLMRPGAPFAKVGMVYTSLPYIGLVYLGAHSAWLLYNYHGQVESCASGQAYNFLILLTVPKVVASAIRPQQDIEVEEVKEEKNK